MNYRELISLKRRRADIFGGSIPTPISYDYMPEGYPKFYPNNVVFYHAGGSDGTALGGGWYDIFNVNEAGGSLVVGDTYIVTFNGVDYQCVCDTHYSKPCLGNKYIFRGQKDTGEPFYMQEFSGTIQVYLPRDGAMAFTYTVKKEEPLVIPMDEKFLPDSVKGGGGGITYLYAEGNRLYTDIDRTEEVEYVDDFWLDQLDLGRMVIIRDVENDYSPNLLTNAGGMVAYCGNKVFYSQGYMGEPS